MTAKDKLLERAPSFTEEQAERALRAVDVDETEAPQPPFSLIGVFHSGRNDLGRFASTDVYEPEPFR